MSKRTPGLLIEDMLASCRKILEYSEGLTFDKFVNDTKTVDAIIRNFEIIGEAANLLPDDIKDRLSEIDWHRIRGLRNRVVHDYFGVDLRIVWKIISDQIPGLAEKLNSAKENIP